MTQKQPFLERLARVLLREHPEGDLKESIVGAIVGTEEMPDPSYSVFVKTKDKVALSYFATQVASMLESDYEDLSWEVESIISRNPYLNEEHLVVLSGLVRKVSMPKDTGFEKVDILEAVVKAIMSNRKLPEPIKLELDGTYKAFLAQTDSFFKKEWEDISNMLVSMGIKPLVWAFNERSSMNNPSNRTLALGWAVLDVTKSASNGVLRDGSPAPEDGVWLEHKGDIESSELIVFRYLTDMLAYGHNSDVLCRVEYQGELEMASGDAYLCQKMRILWRTNPGPALRAFARKCALDVAHLWDPPEVVLRYLKEGREEDRVPSMDATDGAYGVPPDAAYDASYDAAHGDPYNAAFAASESAIAALRNAGAKVSEVLATQEYVLGQMLEEYRRDPTKTWTF